jgi:hypothetical protein
VEVSFARTDDSLEGRYGSVANPQWGISRRLSKVELLLGHKARLVRWKPTLGGAVVGFFVLYQSSDGWATGSMSPLFSLRMAVLAMCLGAVFVLDDPAAVTVAAVPSPLRYRRGLRLILIAPLVATVWASQLLLVFVHATSRLHGGAEGLLPIWGLTLEMVAMMMTGMAIAALATRWVSEGLGGVAAGPTLLVLVVAAAYLPYRWTLFPGSVDDPQWAAAHIRWAAIAVLATLLFMYFSRDPAARRILRLRSRS